MLFRQIPDGGLPRVTFTRGPTDSADHPAYVAVCREDWQDMGCPDVVMVTVGPAELRR